MQKETDPNAVAKPRRAHRLTPIDRSQELLPWKRAHDFTVAELYWIPIASMPASTGQRRWLLTFLERLSAHLAKEARLRQELFLQMKCIKPHLLDAFLRGARENHPLLGLSRHPHAPLPERASLEDVQAICVGRKKFDLNDFVGDYCYWFLVKNAGGSDADLFRLRRIDESVSEGAGSRCAATADSA